MSLTAEQEFYRDRYEEARVENAKLVTYLKSLPPTPAAETAPAPAPAATPTPKPAATPPKDLRQLEREYRDKYAKVTSCEAGGLPSGAGMKPGSPEHRALESQYLSKYLR